MSFATRPTWDIFCKVVDNFGDIGVSWRLCRQLAAEHDLTVRLWVDDLATFHRLNNAIDPALDVQSDRGVEVRRWSDSFLAVTPADVVVETFGCEAPESYQLAMAASGGKSVWINLEYLSAETWVLGCHRLPSPHPRLPLTRYFYFPGFVAETGGVLREADLITKRSAFLNDSSAVEAFWNSLGLAPSGSAETRVSLFCYENPAIADLLQAWAAGDERILCLVPKGRAVEQVSAFFASGESPARGEYVRGNLKVRMLPFVEQPDYDRLLWACDCNFVRGEDSFVRAQWAAAPFVWHIYPQSENAHWIKLNSFIDCYCDEMPPETATELRAFWRAWNSGRGAGQAWDGYWRHRSELRAHAATWVQYLVQQGDLASNLVKFCDNLLE